MKKLVNFSNLKTRLDSARQVENSPIEYRIGFTLIELLVVIFVIGVLAGLLLPNLVSSRQRARDSRRKHDLVEIKNALRLYYNDYQEYPGPSDENIFTFGDNWTVGGTNYMQEVPNDPQSDKQYYYCVGINNNAFVLAASLENAADSGIGESTDRCGFTRGTEACDPGCDDAAQNCYYVCGD